MAESKVEIPTTALIIVSRMLVIPDFLLAFVLYLLYVVEGNVPPMQDNPDGQLFGSLLGGIGIVAVTVSFVLRPILLRRVPASAMRGTPQAMRDHRYLTVLIGIAICQLAGIAGFIFGFLTGELVIAYALLGLSAASKIPHMPTRAWLEREGREARVVSGPDVSVKPTTDPVFAGLVLTRAAIGSDLILALVLIKLNYLHGIRQADMDFTMVTLLTVVLVSVGILAAISTFVLRPILLKRGPNAQQREMENPIGAHRLTVALYCESITSIVAVSGFVLGFLTGQLVFPLVLIGTSAACKIAHFPSRAWLEARK